MLDSNVAERVKEAIKDSGGYKVISERTGLNTRTLTRITSGETDPKLSNFLAIAEATHTSLNYLAFGITTETENRAAESVKGELDKFHKAFEKFEEQSEEMAAIREFLKRQIELDPKLLEQFDITDGKIKKRN